jgi:release factor glutamine methyltransferase
MTVGSELKELGQLRQGKSDTPFLEAQILLAHILGKPRPWVLTHPEAELSPQQVDLFTASYHRLELGEPLPYILGHWEFYGLDFAVTPHVLIPRPETELLVEEALAWIHTRSKPVKAAPIKAAPIRAADVGTGSGCIAVSLAVHTPFLTLSASDQSASALKVAHQNAVKHSVEGRVHFFQANLLAPLKGPLDLVCANLPYIPTVTLASLPVGEYEPRLALDGGLDGLDLIRRLLADAPRWLAAKGLLLLEIEERQASPVLASVKAYLPDAVVRVKQDLQAKDRLVIIRRA